MLVQTRLGSLVSIRKWRSLILCGSTTAAASGRLLDRLSHVGRRVGNHLDDRVDRVGPRMRDLIALHGVGGLEMADDRLDRRSSLNQRLIGGLTRRFWLASPSGRSNGATVST